MQTIEINGVEYVKKEDAMSVAVPLEYCIIRTDSAGVHAGYVESRSGSEVTLRSSRRLWKWAGAFTLSELSRFGPTKPTECKFTCVIDKITLTNAIEIIPCTDEARRSIEGVPDYEC